MGPWSKLQPEIEHLPCKAMCHPWTNSCMRAAAYTWIDSCIGSAGFFGLLYLCQYVSKVLKKKKKVEVKDFFRMHLRSTVFGATLSASTFAMHCVFRKLLGKYTSPTLVFFPGIIGGNSIFIEARRGRELFTNAFANCCLELWMKMLEKAKILNWNSSIQTVIFMFLSSSLSCLLGSTNFDLNYFWFFLPPKVDKTNEKGACFHKGDCKKHIFNLFVMYSTTGFILQCLRLVLNNFKNPKLILTSLITPRTFKLAAFLGGYVVIYQAIRCFLYQKEKKYSLTHDSVAGFLAGAAFRFQPTLPIFNSAIITILQILTEVGCQKRILPNIPYLELMFAFLCGLLFHYRILGDYCPRLMVYFMAGATHGLSDRLSVSVKHILNSAKCCQPSRTSKTLPFEEGTDCLGLITLSTTGTTELWLV